jgi:hypothetical protein
MLDVAADLVDQYIDRGNGVGRMACLVMIPNQVAIW